MQRSYLAANRLHSVLQRNDRQALMDAGSRVNKNAVSYYYCYSLLAGLTWHAKWFAAFLTLKSRCLVDVHKKVLRPGFNMVRDEGWPLATSSLRSLRNSWGRLLASLDVWDRSGEYVLFFFCRGILFFVCWEGRFNHRLPRIRFNSGLSLELLQKGDR